MLSKLLYFIEKNRNTLIAVAALLLVLAVIQIHLISTRDETYRPITIKLRGFTRPTPQPTMEPTVEPPKKASTLPPATTPSKTVPERHKPVSPEDYGLRGRTLTRAKDGLVIPFRISRSERRSGFNPEELEKAFGLTPNQKLFITVEPLDPKAKEEPILRAEISRKFSFYRGYYASFLLKYSKRPRRHFGIFICSDTKSTGRCAGKPPLNLANLGKGRIPRGKNQVYFFNYLMIEGRHAYALDYSLGDKMYYKLRDYLLKVDNVKGALPSHLEMVVKRVIAYSFNLRASQMGMKGPAITIAFRKGL